jgi:thiol-disulfide isomerase/thioredoxin
MVVQGVAIGAVLLSLLSAGPDLGLGDPAPALTIGEWIKGDPVNLAKLKGEKVAVVEFWATWCPPCKTSIPHLTKLQRKYVEKGLVVIGISSGERTDTVKEFVTDWDKKMQYTVAVDNDSNQTNEDWMTASGQGGIPTAFVVDKEGNVVWIGHPMGGLDDVIEQIFAGTYSVEKAIQRQKLEARVREVFRSGDEAEFAKLADEVEEMDLTSRDDLTMKFHIQVMAKRMEKAKATGEEVLEKIQGNPEDLNQFAWAMLTQDPFKGNFADLALKAATEADRLSEGKNWEIVDTLALAKFETGAAEEAVELVKKAIGLAKEAGADTRAIDQMEKALKKFEGK